MLKARITALETNALAVDARQTISAILESVMFMAILVYSTTLPDRSVEHVITIAVIYAIVVRILSRLLGTVIQLLR